MNGGPKYNYVAYVASFMKLYPCILVKLDEIRPKDVKSDFWRSEN